MKISCLIILLITTSFLVSCHKDDEDYFPKNLIPGEYGCFVSIHGGTDEHDGIWGGLIITKKCLATIIQSDEGYLFDIDSIYFGSTADSIVFIPQLKLRINSVSVPNSYWDSFLINIEEAGDILMDNSGGSNYLTYLSEERLLINLSIKCTNPANPFFINIDGSRIN